MSAVPQPSPLRLRARRSPPVREPAISAEPRSAGMAWVLVAAAVIWNLWFLRAETTAVPYLDDGSIHNQMVRFATAQIKAGHLPLTQWFPYLGLGSPHFLHYQSLGAMLTGLVGTLTGADIAYRWSLYLMVSLWPVVIYAAARIFGLNRWSAGLAAALSPFLDSFTHVGYEQGAYVWAGYGVWAQLCASMTLPLAWACTWRAVREGSHVGRAAVFTALTLCFHFETGYLALGGVVLMTLGAGRPDWVRLRRALSVLLGGALLSAWAIVPVFAQRNWAGRNEVLQHTPLVNGYGAGKLLGWLVRGQILDQGRLPEITILFAVGLVLALVRWRSVPATRALVLLFTMSMLLAFGRTTFGALANLLPGARDIFFRRFEMGTQLAAVLLAGAGGAWLGQTLWRAVVSNTWTAGPERTEGRRAWFTGPLVVLAVTVLTLPAWLELRDYDQVNSGEITTQQRADAAQGARVDALLAISRRLGGGRTYAGLPSNWGPSFTVGYVPVFKYLESRDVDEVGYTLRTASLMTQPEYYFDEANPSDYVLFGVRFLLLPSAHQPPVPARRVAQRGDYVLWQVPGAGLIHAGVSSGVLNANRTNVGSRSIELLNSNRAARHRFPLVRWPGGPPVAHALRVASTRGTDTILHQTSALGRGAAAATVQLQRTGLVVLSASYDPGWRARVDGRPAQPLIVAPALVGVVVPPGRHQVTFAYNGYGHYILLFALALLGLGGLAAIRRR